ncbi:MAG: hypothetical protein H0U75_10300 [Legionella sp.]|nr:hypothetical protein [Legionella sp.]
MNPLDIKNNLALKLFKSFDSSNTHFQMADDFSIVDNTQCFEKIMKNIHWINQMNVNQW